MKNLNCCVIIAILFSLYGIAYSQTETTIDVFVRDHYTNEPLAEALVFLIYEGEVADSSYTDSYGRAQVTALSTSVQDADPGIPSTFSVSENYPNPFLDETRVDFDVPEQQTIRAEVYNILGQRVHYEDFTVDAGYYTLNLSLAHLATGTYFLRLRGAEQKTVTLLNLGRDGFLTGRSMPRGNIQIMNRSASTDASLLKTAMALNEFTIRVERDRYETWQETQTFEANTELTVPLERLNEVVFQVEYNNRLDFQKELTIQGLTIEEYSTTVITPDTVVLKSGIYSVWGDTDSTQVSAEIEIASMDTTILFSIDAPVFQFLEPGGVIVGVDRIHIGAPEGAIVENIEISIRKVDDPTMEVDLPEFITREDIIGDFYELTATENVWTSDQNYLVLGLPVPDHNEPENLALLVLSTMDMIIAYENIEKNMLWEVARVHYDENAGLYYAILPYVGLKPQIFSLVEGVHIQRSEFGLDKSGNKYLQEGSLTEGDSPVFVVKCVGFLPSDCTDDHRMQTKDVLEYAYSVFVDQLGYPKPRLRQPIIDIGLSPSPYAIILPNTYEYQLRRGGSMNGWYRVNSKMAATIYKAGDEPYNLVTKHEFFHALQFGFNKLLENWPGDVPWGVIEGTATASERSLTGLTRSNVDISGRNTMKVNRRMFERTPPQGSLSTDYQTQDFWVYLGKAINPVDPQVDFLIPVFEKGGLKQHIDEMLNEEGTFHSLGDAYWRWAKNQSFEKSIVLGVDSNDNPVPGGDHCSLYESAVIFPRRINVFDDNWFEAQTEFELSSLISRIIEITFHPGEHPYEITANISPSDPFGDLPYKFYHEKDAGTDACVDDGSDHQPITVQVFDEEVTVHVLVSNTAFFGSVSGIQLLFSEPRMIDEPVWVFQTGSAIFSSPTVVDTTVYIGSRDHYLYAIDIEKGEEKWKFETGGLIDSSPIVVDGTVYFGSYDNALYAVDAGTGNKIWSFGTGNNIFSSPAVAAGVVYIGSQDNRLYAVNAQTGDEQWRFTTNGVINSSPTVADGIVYIGSTDNSLYAIDAAFGTKLWKYETGATVFSSPTVSQGIVYFGSRDSYLYALNAKNGDFIWSFKTDDWVSSSPAVKDGIVYVGSNDNHVYAINALSGTEEWRFETGGGVFSSPTVTDEAVYVGSFDNSLYVLNRNTGDLISRVDTEGPVNSSPTVVHGVVYVGSDDGYVYAVNLEGEQSSDDSRVALRTLGHHHMWKEEIDEPFDWITSSPTILEQVVYFGSPDNNLYAINAQTGQELWRFVTNGEVFSSPMVVGNRVFTGSADGFVYALDTSQGTELWSVQTGGKIVSSPTVLGSDMYIGSFDGNVYALDVESGEERWVFETEAPVVSSPTVTDGLVYIGSNDNRLYAINTGSGIEEWSFETGGAIYSSPTVTDDDIFIGSMDGSVYAINKHTRDLRWDFETGGAVLSSPTVFEGKVYVGSLDRMVYALDAQTGELQWAVELGDIITSSPTVTEPGKGLFVGSFDNSLYALDANSGNVIWQSELSHWVNSSPIQVDGILYVGSADGALIALESNIAGSSADTRVMLGTLGHHHGWTGVMGKRQLAVQNVPEESSGVNDSPLSENARIRFEFSAEKIMK